MFHRCGLVLCVSVLLFCGVHVASAAYFTDLSALAGNAGGQALGVNASGQVTGFYSSNRHGFLYTDGTMYDIHNAINPSAPYGNMALGINDAGQIAVCQFVAGPGYVYSGGTSGTATQVLYPGTSVTGGPVQAINAAAEATGAGKSAAINENRSTAFIATSDGTAYPLALPVNPNYRGLSTYGFGLNSSGGYAAGYVYGTDGSVTPPWMLYHAVVWSYSFSGGTLSSTATDLKDTLGLPGWSAACSVNDSGQVVGWHSASNLNSSTNPTFLHQIGSGTYTDLGALRFICPLYPTTGTFAGTLINNSGQVVGYQTIGGVNHAALWDSTHGLRDLNDLYAPVLPAGFVLNAATSINNQGFIVGYGTDAAANTQQMFLLRPRMPGDANLDGTVNIEDLSKVLTNYDKSGVTWSDGDFDENEVVNITDLSKVLTNYDKSLGLPSGVKAVPEPSTLLLLATGLAGLLACAWRKRK